MAGNSNKIQFEIGSIFTEEGFTKLNNAIKSAGRETKNVKDMFNGLLSEASKVDGTMGQVAGSVGGVIQAFAQMGIAGGAIAAVQQGVSLLVDKCHELEQAYDSVWQNENAKIEAQNIQLVSGKISDMKNMLSSVKEVAFGNIQAFDQMTQAASRIASVMAQIGSAQGNYNLAQLATQKFAETLNAESEASRKLIDAKYNVLAAQEQQKTTIQEQDAMLKAAAQTQGNAYKAWQMAIDAEMKSKNALVQAQETERIARQKFGEGSAQEIAAKQLVMQAAQAEAQARQNVTARENAYELSAQQHEVAILNHKTAIEKANLSVEQASKAQEGLKAALDYEQAASQYSGYTEQERANAIKVFNDAIHQGASVQQATIQADEALQKARQTREENEQLVSKLEIETKTQHTEALKEFNEQLNLGKTGQEAYNAALEKLKTSAEGLAQEQDKTKDKLKDDAGGKVNVKTTTTVTIDKASMADAIVDGMNRTQGTHAINNIQAHISQQARNQRNFENALNGSVGSLQTAVNGIVNDRGWANDYATAWATKFQSYRWNGSDFDKMANKLMSQHSYTKQQKKDTIRALNKIKSMCVLAGTGKQDNS